MTDDKCILISDKLTPTDQLCLIIRVVNAEIRIYVSVQLFSTPEGATNVAFGAGNHNISCDALSFYRINNS
jgi:hypothetical protein